jgi:hypothetical protein
MDRRQMVADINPDAHLWDDLDDCIIGITEEGCAVYDIHKMEKELMKKNEWDWETAAEFVEFNILQAYIGDFTPVHVWTIPDEKFEKRTI